MGGHCQNKELLILRQNLRRICELESCPHRQCNWTTLSKIQSFLTYYNTRYKYAANKYCIYDEADKETQTAVSVLGSVWAIAYGPYI